MPFRRLSISDKAFFRFSGDPLSGSLRHGSLGFMPFSNLGRSFPRLLLPLSMQWRGAGRFASGVRCRGRFQTCPHFSYSPHLVVKIHKPQAALIILITLFLMLPACKPPNPSSAPQISPPTVRPSLRTLPTAPPRQIITPTGTIPPTFTPAPPTPTLIIPTAALVEGLSLGDILVGYSYEGRPLVARRFGEGSQVLLLVGGMHGGWEANTVALMQQLIDHFTNAPQDIPSGTALVIAPLVNPDGYQLGRVARGRFNGAGVDLNRNWSCDWSPDAYWRQQRVDAGDAPLSEPETQALSDFILQLRPAGALFFHSAANGVFAGECDGDHGSQALSQAFGESAGYPHGSPFTAYPVTGTAASWADGEGIPAADVELRSSTDSEYERNLRGVLGLLEWLAAAP